MLILLYALFIYYGEYDMIYCRCGAIMFLCLCAICYDYILLIFDAGQHIDTPILCLIISGYLQMRRSGLLIDNIID